VIREIRLLGKGGDVSGWEDATDPGTSPYPWANTPSQTLSQIWNDDTVNSWAYNQDIYGPSHSMLFEPGPTLALFTKVRFDWSMDYSQQGPNNWWFPPDNAAGPTVRLSIRNRAGNGWLNVYSYTFVTPGDDVHNTNTNTESPTPKYFSYSMTSHPELGPWTLSDINHLAAGLGFSVYPNTGDNNKPWADPMRFNKFRAFTFKCYLTVQDLGGYVRSVRHNSSATLRMKRKARNTITMTIPAHQATKEIGEIVNVAHTRGLDPSGEGWGERSLERRSGWLSLRTYWPEALKVVDECYDLHDFACEAWAAFRIPIAWTPELSGIAYLDRGGEWTCTRAGDGWSLRPGDGVALRVLEDYPNLSEDGLALHSANGTALALYNFDPSLAGWSTTDASGGTVTYTAETTSVMVDELGYQTALLMEFPGTPGTSGKKRDVSLTAGDTVSVRARVRNISVDDPNTKFLEVALLDGLGNYWSESTRTWVGTPTFLPISSVEGFGEVVLDQIPVAVTGTHTIKVGRFSSAINSCSFIIALVDVVQNDFGMGMPMVTLAAPVARVADVFEMDNAAPFTFWHRDRGMVIAEFRPFWRAESLAAATQKRIVLATHAASAWDELRFVAGATDQFVAERYDVPGGSRTVAVDIKDAAGAPLHLTRAHYARVVWRWLDADGWRDRAPYEAMISYAVYNAADETFVSYYENTTTWAAPDGSAEDVVILSGLDGWLRWIEVKHSIITGSESVWRR
jgi:hypothetical protein